MEIMGYGCGGAGYCGDAGLKVVADGRLGRGMEGEAEEEEEREYG